MTTGARRIVRQPAVDVAASPAMRHCKWCGVFVRVDQPAFTWYRAFGPMEFIGDRYQQVGPDYGWTDPKTLCQSCAEAAHDWDACHRGLFAEVGP